MSRRSIKEYILRKRDDYLGETPRGKHKMLDETIRLTSATTKTDYSKTLHRVKALLSVTPVVTILHTDGITVIPT